MIAEYLGAAAIGYFLGSIPAGLLTGYLFLGRDIRTSGSGKTGTTNVLRTAGKKAAAIVLLLDVLKGVIPAIIGRFVFHDDVAAALGASAAIVGHVFPVFAGFRGGRGVASAFGGVLGLTPVIALLFPLIALALVVSTRIVSVMSVIATPIAALIVIILAIGGWQSPAYAFYAAFALIVVECTHIPNIKRLIAGTEPRIGMGGDRPATG